MKVIKHLCIALVLSAASLASAKVAEFSPLPTEPFVRDTDLRVSESITYYKNWFSFGGKVTNLSLDTMTIVGLRVEVKSSAGEVLKVQTFDSAQQNSPYYLELGPGATHIIKTYLGSDTPETFVVDGISDGTGGDAFRHNVEVKLIGWMGTYEAPTGNLDATSTFQTR